MALGLPWTTTTAIAILNGDPAANRAFEAEPAVGMPAVTAGEWLFGAVNSRLGKRNRERFEFFIARAVLLPIDLPTARRYSEPRYALKLAGRPIPHNDLWIAATALEHGLTLVTSDVHFSYCPDLELEDWLSGDA